MEPTTAQTAATPKETATRRNNMLQTKTEQNSQAQALKADLLREYAQERFTDSQTDYADEAREHKEEYDRRIERKHDIQQAVWV
jgi:hypothetical protein